MRVGIDYTAAVRQGAGIGRYTRSLVRALAELRPAGEYVLFSAGSEQDAAPWPVSFIPRAIPLTDRHLSVLWHRLRLPVPVEMFTGRLDIFHSPDFVLPPVWHAKKVLTIHDLSFVRLPECSSPALLHYLMGTVPRSIARADLLLADSESTRRDLIELMQVEPERIRVIYPAVDASFAPAPEGRVSEMRALYGLPETYILAVGTLQPRKNYIRLIEAYALLHKRTGVPHQLVVVGGPGWLYEPIYATIDRLGLQEQVRILGYTPEEDLPALYTGAEIFAFPSLYEGFGIPVLEAMACGTPVITSDTSSLPEAAGDAALLVSPLDTEALADALEHAITDRDLREQLVSRGREQCRRFSWDAAARELLACYTTLMNGDLDV